MTRLLVVAHAPLASALAAVARHLFPDCARSLDVLDVQANEDVQEVAQRLRSMLAPGEPTLLLADVVGATPCNAAQLVADGAQARVVSGVSVPMLWRALWYAGEPLEALVTRAVDGGVQGTLQLATTRPQNQTSPPAGRDDQVNDHHQQ